MVAESLSNVMRPVGEASGLPNRHYTDPATFETERDRVVFADWAGFGFASDVPEAGDALPVNFMGMPLLLVRDRAGQVRIFQNTCRHRGMILVAESEDGKPRKLRGMIRCPYHSWVYDLDGQLKATPHVGGPGRNVDERIDRSTLGLFEIRSHVWHDIVFVNVSGDAPDFAERHESLLVRWADFEKPGHPGGSDSKFDLTVTSNWKLAVENYCESYHLPWIHPGLNSYSRLEDHYNIVADAYSGQGTTVYNPSFRDGAAFADYPDLPAAWDRQAEYVALYPNVLLGVHRDHRFAILLLPDGPERTVERVSIEYASTEMTGPDLAGLRQRNAAMWKEVFEEDIFVVEGMQRGRHGAFFDGGRFSPAMDEPTWAFHRWVASRFEALAAA